MQANATSGWMVVNSKESARTACDRPQSASASKPSTSILMNAGTPYLAISASSVVISTSANSPQCWVSQPGAPSAAATNAEETDDTVGLSELISIRALPGCLPTATTSIVTAL